MELNKVYLGDAIELAKTLPDESIDCVVTSPPYYGLRDYGVNGQIGLEDSPEEYIERLVVLFSEIRRALKKDGTCWVNLGDSYCGTGDKGNYQDPKYKEGRNGQVVAKNKKLSGYKSKDLIGIPWMFAFAMRADGWYLRQDIIWAKPNPMPESVTDRCTKSHEYIFLFSKKEKYYFDNEAIQEEAVTQLEGSYKFGGNKYGKNDDTHFNYYSGEEWKPRTRWGSGTKKERTHEQNYSQAENGGHRDNSGGFDSEMSIKDGVVVRNKRDVWTVNVKPNKEAHFATYPQKLISPCILAGCREGGAVLDPFMGSGTTGIVARKLGRNYIGFELNPEYWKMATRRIINEGENLFNQQA